MGILFKGKQSYLEIRIEGEIPFDEAFKQISKKMESGKTFFSGSACVKVLGGDFSDVEKSWFDKLFKDSYGIISTEYITTEQLSKAEKEEKRKKKELERSRKLNEELTIGDDVPVRLARRKLANNPEGEEPKRPLKVQSKAPEVKGACVILRKSIKDGEIAESQGDLVVLGNVERGAKLEAVGSIVVLGRLEGSASAGVNGDGEVTISAAEFAPERVRIGGSREKDYGDRETLRPETGFLKEGEVTVGAVVDE